jgi:hypothetical protein
VGRGKRFLTFNGNAICNLQMAISIFWFFTVCHRLHILQYYINFKCDNTSKYNAHGDKADTLRHPRLRDHGFYGPPKGHDGSPRAGARSAEARGLPSWREGGP